MVQEAWYYTRAVGIDVVHGATTFWIPTAARGVDLQGVVIKYWGSVVTAVTGIQVDWYTGIQVDWYTGVLSTLGVLLFHSLFPSVIVIFCLYFAPLCLICL